ncbi:MAG: hypothetical protein HZC41_06285 [Chloroflexi bacterium]|nr:hypothetical protein [Chloroflexota bacterium]
MATLLARKTAARRAGNPASSLRFDWVYAALSAWVVGGLYLDGWAHSHGRVDDTFFTPWHAVLYSGVLAISVFLFVNQWRGLGQGYALWRALPVGYTVSLLGAGLFIVGGGIDFVWHELFGFEANLEALLSPAHLLLATSGILMITGPLRSGYYRLRAGQAYGWRELGPVLVSLLAVLSILTFFTDFAHPATEFYATHVRPQRSFDPRISLNIAGILLHTGLLMGMLLFALRRWLLPVGAITLLLGINGALMTVFTDTREVIPAFVAAGLIADGLRLWLKPALTRPGAWYGFAFLVPLALFSLYFLTAQLTGGIGWTIHLWLGTIFMAGVMGLLVSFLLLPPFQKGEEVV